MRIIDKLLTVASLLFALLFCSALLLSFVHNDWSILNTHKKAPLAVSDAPAAVEKAPAVQGSLINQAIDNTLPQMAIQAGPEKPIPENNLFPMEEKIMARPLAIVSDDELDGQLGRLLYNPDTLYPEQILLSNRLGPKDATVVLGHQLGYAINMIVGGPRPDASTKGMRTGIPIKGIEAELRRVYSAGITGEDRAENLVGPEDRGFKGDEIGRQLMAEAIHTNLLNPNYMRKVAPNARKRIREYMDRKS